MFAAVNFSDLGYGKPVMATTETLSSSQEDYLEAIFHLVTEHKVARARDIADRLNVSRPSVTTALRLLAEKGLVDYSPYELIDLTPAGTRLAKDIVRRHTALKAFLMNVLAVGDKDAEETACKMEHIIPPQVMERFIAYSEFLQQTPQARARWVRGRGFELEDAAGDGSS